MNLNAAQLWGERPDTCLSRLVLDRHAVGETQGAEALEIDAHAAQCAACSAKLLSCRQEARDFESSSFVAGRVARARALVGARPRPTLPWVAGGALATLAAAALLVVALEPGRVAPQPPGEASPPAAVRSKGGEVFSLVARRADGEVIPVLPGEALAAGDAVRFRVALEEAAYVAVVSVDSTPEITLYYPWDGDPEHMDVTPGKYLAGSVVLDEVLGPEQIIAVFCPHPIGRTELLAAARRALETHGGRVDALDRLGVACVERPVLIQKVAR
jgi:hypothetical protein